MLRYFVLLSLFCMKFPLLRFRLSLLFLCSWKREIRHMWCFSRGKREQFTFCSCFSLCCCIAFIWLEGGICQVFSFGCLSGSWGYYIGTHIGTHKHTSAPMSTPNCPKVMHTLGLMSTLRALMFRPWIFSVLMLSPLTLRTLMIRGLIIRRLNFRVLRSPDGAGGPPRA